MRSLKLLKIFISYLGKNRYEVYYRLGNDKELIDCFDADKMTNLISHFKFVAGMDVGEKRRSQLGSCDYTFAEDEQISLRLSSVGDYRGRESLVIRLLYYGQKSLHYWFDGLEEALSVVNGRGLYLFSGPVGSGKTTLMYQLVQENFQINKSLPSKILWKFSRIICCSCN